MKFDILTIIAGLEEAYFNIVQFGSVSAQNVIRQKTLSPAKQLRSIIGNRSFFVKWQSLYNGLSSARHIAWTDYWGTLPFGTHWGANEYPGSGFSAFVYLNAPRYQAGLPLLLDPVVYSELVYNGGFVGNANGWRLFDGAYYSSNAIHFDSADQYADFLLQDVHLFPLVEGGTFRISCDYSIGAGYAELYLYNRETADVLVTVPLIIGAGHTFRDVTVHNSHSELSEWTPFFLSEVNSDGYITNISVIQIA